MTKMTYSLSIGMPPTSVLSINGLRVGWYDNEMRSYTFRIGELTSYIANTLQRHPPFSGLLDDLEVSILPPLVLSEEEYTWVRPAPNPSCRQETSASRS